MATNTGSDAAMIARVALQLGFSTIRRLAKVGKLTTDDIDAIQAFTMNNIDGSRDGKLLMHHIQDNFDWVREVASPE